MANHDSNENLAIWFTPEAIRDSFEAAQDERAAWVKAASDATLADIGETCLSYDLVWDAFNEALDLAIDDAMQGAL